jgi:hypothetical protein
MRQTSRTAWTIADGIGISLSRLSAGLWFARRPPCPCAAMGDWAVGDLGRQLRRYELGLRAVPALANGPLWSSVYRTTTDKTREQLSLRAAVAERIADWNGTVFCSRSIAAAVGDAPSAKPGAPRPRGVRWSNRRTASNPRSPQRDR